MAKKLCKDEVLKNIKTKITDDYDILDFNYENYSSIIKIRHNCGYIISRSYKVINGSKHIMCDKCQNKNQRDSHSGIKYSLNEVKEYINSVGCEFLDGDYRNNKSILHVKCHCKKNDYYRSFGNIKKGEINCEECSRSNTLKALTKYSVDEVEKEISKDGYVINDKSNYINAYTGLSCTCSNNHTFDLVFSEYLFRGRGCKKCGILKKSGENHWNYKGGESEVIDVLRKSISDWKKDVLAYYGFKCAITNSKEDVVVHHFYSFSNLLDNALSICNLKLLNKIKDYNEGEFEKLKNTLLSIHERENGIAICRDIHNKFHLEYGKGNNNYEQFSEFLYQNYNLSLDDIVNNKSKLYKNTNYV